MNPNLPAPLAVTLGVVDVLNDLGIRYHLGGSFASAVHGVPRQTLDAGLVVELDRQSVTRLMDRLHDGFYVDAGVAADAVSRAGSFNAIHLETGFKVDFFVKGDAEFDEAEFERSELQRVTDDPPRSVHVKSAEDTILRKLHWFVRGGEFSDRQWRDVLGVMMAVGEAIDRGYLEQWADRLGLREVLNRALNEAEAS